MTASTVKIIITAEVAEQKVEVGTIEFGIDDQLDESIHQGMQGMAKMLYGAVVQGVDDGLREAVPEDWRNVGREARRIMTCVGTVAVKRRVYKDRWGKRHKPLDEVLSLERYERYSQSVKQKGSYLASELAYREAAQVMSWLIRDYISHSAIGRMIKQVGGSYLAEERDALARVFEKGELIEPGNIPAKVLYGESDGVYISLQRAERRKAEVRVGILYTGKKVIGIKRKALVNKVMVSKIVENSQEWQETLLKTAYEHYDLAGTTQMIVGGDGSKWVRQSFDLLNLPTEYVLDRYHIYREARRAFGHTSETDNWIKRICQGKVDEVLPEMMAVIEGSPSKVSKKMQEFVKYLINNWEGLLDPDCRTHLQTGVGNLGAIEGNVDKLVVRRMKGRGRSWSLAGANAMLAVCARREELKQEAFRPFKKVEVNRVKKPLRKKVREDGDWLQAGVPALHLCHSNRPWAMILKDRIHPDGVL